MFLLVSVRHVGAHPSEHQHSVSVQISTSLGNTFLRISRIRNIPLTWILARVFVYVPPLISQILNFIFERFLFLFWSIFNGVTLKTNNCSYRYPVGRNRLGCHAIALLVHLYPFPIGEAAEMVRERILCKPPKAITSKVIIIRLKCLWNRCRSEQEQIGNRPVRRRKTCSFIVHTEYHFCTVIESPYFYILFYNTARVSVRKQAGREYMEELRDPSLLLIINFKGKNKWK